MDAAIFDIFREMPWVLWLVVAVFSLAVGSFLNVVIYRLPKMMQHNWRQECLIFLEKMPADQEVPCDINLCKPRSTCPKCETAIKARHNIPVLSYLLLKGKCANCQAKISCRYPLIELLCAVLSVIIAINFGWSIQMLAGLVLCWMLIAMSFIDIDEQLLPDSMTLPLLWLGLLLNLGHVFTDLQSAVIGAIAGYLCLWIIMQSYRVLTGKQGMGHGDFKLLAAFGAWFGWQMLPAIVLLAATSGAVIGILYLIISRQGKNTPIPFGPYLAIAGLIALLFGPQLIEFYML